MILIAMSASSREGRHGQRVLLVDGVQLHGAHGVSDELQLLGERLAAVRHADVGDVGAADVVADGTLLVIVGPQPVAFGLPVRKTFISLDQRQRLFSGTAH